MSVFYMVGYPTLLSTLPSPALQSPPPKQDTTQGSPLGLPLFPPAAQRVSTLAPPLQTEGNNR